MHLSLWQWVFLGVAAFCTGLSKTGLAGLGILQVVIFANVLPAKESTGALLPLLLCADIFGVAFYRKHASWVHLWGLFAWVVVGVGAGYFAMVHLNDSSMKRIIGGILLVMLAVHFWRRHFAADTAPLPRHSVWLPALMGILAGFATMLANAAGPVMSLYFLALALPKNVFIGTGAWFFMLVNAFKVPFSLKLGLITPASLALDAALIVPMIPGALVGPWIIRKIDQRAFEYIVLALVFAGTIRLIW